MPSTFAAVALRPSSARLRVVKADIGKNLVHGEVSLAAVAARLGLTPRYVQRLFAAEGTTFSDFVLGERLTRAYGLLTDPHRRGCISAIAFEVGFGDLSYFNRTFRRRYGVPPSRVRAEAVRCSIARTTATMSSPASPSSNVSA